MMDGDVIMNPTHKKLILKNPKETVFPQSLKGNLQIYYENVQHPTIFQDKSGNNQNGTVNGTVTNTTYLGKNIKTFAGAGNVIMPSGQNVNYLYPFKYDGLIKDIGMHQGISFDGTYWYASHDMFLRKYDANFNIVAEHATINDHTGGNHVGDIDYYNGLIYVVTETYTNCTTFSDQKISTFNASDLSYVESHDVSAQNHEVSGITINASDGYIYVISYCSTATIQRYSLSDFSYVDNLTTITITGKQGINYYGGELYVSTDSKIYKLSKTGATLEILLTYPVGMIGEGLHVLDANTIYAITSPTNSLYRFVKNDNSWSIILWFKTPYLPNEIPKAFMRLIDSMDDYFSLYYNKTSASALYCKVTGGNSSGTAATRPYIREADNVLEKNKFMMATVTYDGNLLKLYLNNAQPGYVPSFDADNALIVTWDLFIGGRTVEPDYYFVGDIGELAILNKALSTDEITELYNRTRVKYGV